MYSPALTEILDREAEPPGGTHGADVDYSVDGQGFRGYLATPAGVQGGPVPGVLVIHDWLGMSDTVRMRCDMLARIGYLAFAADLYGIDTRPSPTDAPKVAGAYRQDQARWRQRVTQAHQQLLASPGIDPARTAAIGYCFGGSSVLQLARTGAALNGIVSFHAGLQAGADGEAARIKARLLILHGADDPVTPPDAMFAFERELRETKNLDWQLVTYGNAVHAFTIPGADDPAHGAQYNERADRRSWTAMKDFLSEVFAAGSSTASATVGPGSTATPDATQPGRPNGT